VYDYWKTPTKKTLWRVAVATIEDWNNFDPNDINAAADKNQMNVEVSRYLTKAKVMIHNAGFGRFPDVTKPQQVAA
jgi:short-subunit dehydrogenase